MMKFLLAVNYSTCREPRGDKSGSQGTKSSPASVGLANKTLIKIGGGRAADHLRGLNSSKSGSATHRSAEKN